MRRLICNAIAAALLIAAGAYLIYGSDKGLGIFLVLVAAVLCRVLVLNLGESLADPPSRMEP